LVGWFNCYAAHPCAQTDGPFRPGKGAAQRFAKPDRFRAAAWLARTSEGILAHVPLPHDVTG
jgi:hypothetical protein